MGIQRIGDELPDWLTLPSEREEGSKGLRPVRLRELLPGGFDAYLRLFHPFRPWMSEPDDPDESKLRTWRSLAEEAGVEFTPQLTWGSLEPALPLGPNGRGRPFAVDEGTLHPVVRRHLFPILGAHTDSATCNCYFGLSAIIGGDGRAVLLQASLDALDDVCALARAEGWSSESPEYLWPEDRSWVLCTDYDLDSSYLAAGRELAAAVSAERRLESASVSPDTRVDRRADEPL